MLVKVYKDERFTQKYTEKAELEHQQQSFQQTVALWDEMRAKMERQIDHHRERADKLHDTIQKVVSGNQLSPQHHNDSRNQTCDRTTLVATGGDVTISVSDMEQTEALVNKLALYLKDKDDNVRQQWNDERDQWSEQLKELEDDNTKMRKRTENFERDLATKEDEIKKLQISSETLKDEYDGLMRNFSELKGEFQTQKEKVKKAESEIEDLNRKVEEKNCEVKKIQIELTKATATMVVADREGKVVEEGMNVLREQLMEERQNRLNSEQIRADLEFKLKDATHLAEILQQQLSNKEDEESRFNEEIARLQAMFEASEEQVKAAVKAKNEMASKLDDMDSIVSQAYAERDNAHEKIEHFEKEKVKVDEELKTLRQENDKQLIMNESLTRQNDALEKKVEKARDLHKSYCDKIEGLAKLVKEHKGRAERLAQERSQLREEIAKQRDSYREDMEKLAIIDVIFNLFL